MKILNFLNKSLIFFSFDNKIIIEEIILSFSSSQASLTLTSSSLIELHIRLELKEVENPFLQKGKFKFPLLLLL